MTKNQANEFLINRLADAIYEGKISMIDMCGIGHNGNVDQINLCCLVRAFEVVGQKQIADICKKELLCYSNSVS